MTALTRIDATDPQAVLHGIQVALDGGAALGLGDLTDAPTEVPDGIAAVIATSGSSGVPKQVMLSADALRASAEATAARLGTGRWVLALPAGYVAGLQVLVRSVLAGTEPVALTGPFTVEAFVAATAEAAGEEPLYISLVPAQLQTLLDASDDDAVRDALRAYRAILIGGQALPQHVRQQAADLGARIVRTYGSSETAGGCVYDGVALDGVTLRTVEGEVRIAGAMLADGYLGDAALTERVFVTDEHGVRWYRTGDLGAVVDGVLQVTGRADNVIVSGGINVSLDRVERVVREVPGLEQAVVVGIPDERWGEASMIVVGSGTGDGQTLFGQARERVADVIGKHARPVQLDVDPQFPMLASGKPDRAAIRRRVQD